MYLLLAILGIITFIHSILFVFIIQRNAEITNKLNQISRRKSSKINEQSVVFKREMNRRAD